jgi:hypothetical protein
MGFYLLFEGNQHRMDMARAKFFLGRCGWKRKYHIVGWDRPCKPKAYGGLGFADTRIRNIYFLSKWIYRLERGDNDLCCQILRINIWEKGVFTRQLNKDLDFGKGYIKNQMMVENGF